jgi:uncharacterized protein GlcG (DUF336 family)
MEKRIRETPMADTEQTLKLTSNGALKILQTAIEKATAMGVPQCITIVDAGGHMLAFCRMDGAFVLSNDSSLKKAVTAAIYGQLTGQMDDNVALKLAIATDGKRVNLPGGLPIIVDGHVIGGIGVGSGSGAQDLEVAKAGIAALEGAQLFD